MKCLNRAELMYAIVQTAARTRPILEHRAGGSPQPGISATAGGAINVGFGNFSEIRCLVFRLRCEPARARRLASLAAVAGRMLVSRRHARERNGTARDAHRCLPPAPAVRSIICDSRQSHGNDQKTPTRQGSEGTHCLLAIVVRPLPQCFQSVCRIEYHIIRSTAWLGSLDGNF